ncbi:transporter substrate-binding domain-containing protein [Acetivibrio mesophilus]|uniref:Amino acid ABC transporter substrate-binding protein n=1 Tax=Acetivibrio mesophilus TaxID=2487273 RepID=A0A4Q0I2T6_9FIRM|nr:transporter substrate-binding domain-containing protein [Acetivibrio mesophilus]ODM27073.1 amino acid ABC transporter substrate-binding protein [Clostridium sp. Bc-iso-3]RXE58481.1 amino acid ABC transporter substrate-binding protein [Acetivibrio mesophilus]HHV30086.1 transporter substrate-binding domain-containing protein [Clostridium sp.]
MKKGFILTVAMLMLCSFILTGCNSGSESSRAKVIDIPLTEEEYAFGVDKNQPELLSKVNEFISQIKSDGTLEKISNKYFGDGEPEPVTSAVQDSSKDQLIIATNAAFEPFEYIIGDKYYGIDMEIAALLADHLGKELVINNMDFDAVCLSVGQGKADIAMSGLTIKEDRKEYVTFTDKYYNASQKLIVKENDTTFDNCKTAADVEAILSGLSSDTKIGVQIGTTGQFYVEGDEDWGFEGYNVKCVGYKSGSLAVQDMLNGNISYVIIDEAPAQSIVRAINELN